MKWWGRENETRTYYLSKLAFKDFRKKIFSLRIIDGGMKESPLSLLCAHPYLFVDLFPVMLPPNGRNTTIKWCGILN